MDSGVLKVYNGDKTTAESIDEKEESEGFAALHKAALGVEKISK